MQWYRNNQAAVTPRLPVGACYTFFMPSDASREQQSVLEAGTVYANLLADVDAAQVTQEFRDKIDAIARRINLAQEKNIYGFVCKK